MKGWTWTLKDEKDFIKMLFSNKKQLNDLENLENTVRYKE